MGNSADVFTALPKSDLWGTPPELRDSVARHLCVKISGWDPCPYPRPVGYDGLLVNWSDHVSDGEWVFVNPPFSDLFNWSKKAVEMQALGVNVLFFAAARMDNRCWQKNLLPNSSEVLFLSPRVKFVVLGDARGDYHGQASFPSAIAVLPRNFGPTGMCATASGLRWK